jgi:two-component system, LytTR family, sensor kinase
MNALKNIISNIFQNRIIQHLLFWLASYYYLIHSFSITRNIETIDYIYTGVFHLNIVAGVYINLYMLIPRVLGKKSYFIYIIFFTLLLAITAQLNIFIFNYAIDYFLPGYFFVSSFNFLELVQFGFVYLSITTLLKLSKAWFKLMESKNQLIRLEKEKYNAELLFLKSQVNPHFLFNTLNNIYCLALKKNPLAPHSLLKLAGVMRYMIYESTGEFVSLEKEISYIHNYIDLQRLRTRDDTSIIFEVTGTVISQQVAPLIFIVFIENSFKHGIKSAINHSFVHIKISVENQDLFLTVKNSKGIVDEVENERFAGLGVNNVKKRLELLYKEKYSLMVEETEDIYAVELTLNLQ